MRKLLWSSSTMNKYINPKHGLGNMDLNLHTSIISGETWRQRNHISPTSFEVQRLPRTPTHCCAHAPMHHQLSCFTYGLVLRGYYVNTVTIREAVQAFPLLLTLLDHPPGCQQHPIIVRTTETSTEDLLCLQVEMREVELLLETCFTYSLTKPTLATHKGKALHLNTSAQQGPLLFDKIMMFLIYFKSLLSVS